MLLNGGVTDMGATFLVQPVDLIKVSMQLGQGNGSMAMAKNVFATKGFMALYKGLSTGMLRQGTYLTLRLGILLFLTNKIYCSI
jgi:hypothetical protein